MVPEAPFEPTDSGLVQAGEGWFVVNAREARWRYAEGQGSVCPFGDEPDFPQVGVNLFVLRPGEPMGMYHWEADQEDFLVLSGEALLIVEGKERPLQRWDLVHCPAGTKHIIVGAGDAPCAVLAMGAREHQAGADWAATAWTRLRSDMTRASSRRQPNPLEAYARFSKREPTRYCERWLPGS